MFYGKECNFYFDVDSDEDFDVFFLLTEKDKSVEIANLPHEYWNTVDTCILWAAYHLFIEEKPEFTWYKIKIQDINKKTVMEFTTQDELLEKVWDTLTDVNIDEDECIEQNWFIFEEGTYREDIWHWFDEHHSKGVGWLINEYESEL